MENQAITHRDYFLLAANLLEDDRASLVRRTCLKDPAAFEFFKNICPDWANVLSPALPEFTLAQLNESEKEIRDAISNDLTENDDFLTPPGNDRPSTVESENPVSPMQ